MYSYTMESISGEVSANIGEITAERVKKHQDTIAEAYRLYSSVQNGFKSILTERKVPDKTAELWFLACKLQGIPPSVCGVYIIENYRNGDPIQFRSRGMSLQHYKEFSRLKETIYTRHIRRDDSHPYREELESTFDLRKTGQLGVAVVDLIDEELLQIIQLDDLEEYIFELCDSYLTRRNLVFQIHNNESPILSSLDTGSWNEYIVIGPNEANLTGNYAYLLRKLFDPMDSAVQAGMYTELRSRYGKKK